jgi:peptidoglycan/LPS O-acetylase OafA/YrhL
VDRKEPSGYMVQLNGLRALAALSVLYQHTISINIFDINIGCMGVRLFFVLSGFLITDILLRASALAEEQNRGWSHIALSFYARRFLRIFPLYYLVVFGAAALDLPNVRRAFSWLMTYTMNFYMASIGHPIGPPGHFWSLAVEEQFYLVWPAVIFFVPRHKLPALFFAMIAISNLFFAIAFKSTWSITTALMLTPSCFDALGMGAVIAWLRQEGIDPDRRGKLFERAAWVGTALAMLALALTLGHRWVALRLMLWNLSFTMIFGYLVNRAADGRDGCWGRVLEFPPLVYLGSISYGLYVYHYFVPDLVGMLERASGLRLGLPITSGFSLMAYVTLLTIPLAAISWHVFEQPINDLKRFFPYTGPARAPSGGDLKGSIAAFDLEN